MSKIWIIVACVFVVALVLRSRASASSKVTAKEKIKQGALVLDVRTTGEYQDDHYQGAVNIPVQELEARLSELKDRKRAIVVHCASGVRSARAVKILTSAGFLDVTDAGGLAGLR